MSICVDILFAVRPEPPMEPSKSSCSTYMLFLNIFAMTAYLVGHLGKLHAEVGHELTDNPGSIMQKSWW